jgi:MYXO-CTERM domain-containing protein
MRRIRALIAEGEPVRLTPTTLSLALSLFALPALADLAPPDGYVESCTLEKQQSTGLVCKLCETYHGNPADYCAKQAGAGFLQACRTRGASVWGEVWCIGDAADAGRAPSVADAAIAQPSDHAGGQADAGDDRTTDPGTVATIAAPTPKSSSQGCSLSASATNGALSAAVLLLSAAGLLLRRRRQQ